MSEHAGVFEFADGGTLFLDEIGEMPLAVQPKLLRVLEEDKVRRLGATTSRTVDVRIVAPTNVDLDARVRDGRFRADLYHRLATFHLVLPPLRERQEDLPALVVSPVRRHSERSGKPVPQIRPEFVKNLQGFRFPGNIRELRNLVCLRA